MSLKRFKVPTNVQTILFDRAIWTPIEARAWLKGYGFSTKMEQQQGRGKMMRFRQAPPAAFQGQTFRTISFGGDDHGIKAVVGVPKGRRKNPEGLPLANKGAARRARKSTSTKRENPAKPRTQKGERYGGLVRHNIPDVLAVLGAALALQLTNGRQIDFSKGWLFTATETGKTIWLVKAGKRKPTIAPAYGIVRKARELYERFTDFEASTFELASVPTAQTKFRLIGKVGSLAYESDKWSGRKTGYVHEFKNAPSVWSNGDGAATLFMIRGSKLRITARGVTG